MPTSQHLLHIRSRHVAKSSPAERIYQRPGERLGVSPPCHADESGKPTAESRLGEPAANGHSPLNTCDFPNTEHLKPKTIGEADSETIGTTSNHPFWSVDRQEFVQAGSLEIGERLQTLSGDVKVVQQKLPRPGPQPVFNLEVHNEHVYFVGQDGVLVHNAYDVSDAAARRAYLNQKFGRTGNLDADINARGLDDAIQQNAFLATDMARADRVAGRIGSSPRAVGIRAHSHFERLNNRLGSRIAGDFRIATEQFRDANAAIRPKRLVTFASGFQLRLPQRGTIGADLVVTGRNGTTRLFDLKTHNGTLGTMSANRELDFLSRFRARSMELIHVRQ